MDASIDIATVVLAEGIWSASPAAEGYGFQLAAAGVLIKTFDPVQVEMLAAMFGGSADVLSDIGISLISFDPAALVGGAWLIAGHDLTGSTKPNGFVVVGADTNNHLTVLHRQSTMMGAPSIIVTSPRRGIDHSIVISDDPVVVLAQDADYIQMCATTGHWRLKDVLQVLKTHPYKDFIIDKESTSAHSIHNWTRALEAEGRVVEKVRYACNDDLSTMPLFKGSSGAGIRC